MKNLVINSIALICCSALLFLASCEKENLDDTETVITDPQGNGEDEFDCLELALNYGDACQGEGFTGVVTQNCECDEIIVEGCDSVTNLSASFLEDFPEGVPSGYFSIGDECSTASDQSGFINENCYCEAITVEFDCPELQANEGDPCFVGDVGGQVDQDCNCIVDDEESFCYELTGASPNYTSGYIGDECWTLNNEQGAISENCECLANNPDLTDCPDFYESGVGANFGDECEALDVGTGFWYTGIIDENCSCEPVDCQNLGLNVGDPCQGGWGIVTSDCDCVENPD
ncbi:MAG: hypothetical protein AB8B53_00735 [Flavobacteriales bacterium]